MRGCFAPAVQKRVHVCAANCLARVDAFSAEPNQTNVPALFFSNVTDLVEFSFVF